jgi:putative membrane protein
MATASQILVGLVAALHVYFLVLEMFLWATPYGAKTFARPLDEQIASKTLAANQGLYNGFLAAGLVWSFISAPELLYPLRMFFLGCVVIAGLYGAATVSKKILFIQGIPAAAAMIVTYLAVH